MWKKNYVILSVISSRLTIVRGVMTSPKNVKPKKPKEHTPKIHLYRNLYPWQTLGEFVNCLFGNIVYNHPDGLMALNKPYGVPIYSLNRNEQYRDVPKNIVETVMVGMTGESKYCFEDALPLLKEKLGVEQLHIVKSTERYTSGLILLATNDAILNRTRSSLLKSKPLNMQSFHFRIVTMGTFDPPELNEKVGIVLQDIDKETRVPMIKDVYSKRSVTRDNLKPVLVNYKTISESATTPTCSLVDIAITSNKMHFMRVYCPTKGASILGDSLYSQRLKFVQGKAINISPQNWVASSTSVLPDSLIEALQISPNFVASIPTHIHLKKVVLPYMTNSKLPIVLEAPVPDYFQWTCERLGLRADEEVPVND